MNKNHLMATGTGGGKQKDPPQPKQAKTPVKKSK